MAFILSEDQQMLRDTAMAFARDELPVTHLRELRDGGANGVDANTRTKLAELGCFGVLVPEEYDGVGLGMVVPAALTVIALATDTVAPAALKR